MSHLLPGGRVLDWGCGPGMFSYHLKAGGFGPDPIDASAEMVALAREKYGLDARQATFADPLDPESYHGIWANFSLLHAPRADLPGHIAAANTALTPEGILHIGMKHGNGVISDTFGRRCTYVETEELTRILESTGFEILKTHEGAEAGLAGTVDTFVLVLGRRV
ncbi:class I SAM-dependent methyltransferase [Roseibium sp.]|uniref:class I SAM-dependent methyltransferase n=1 Tax=Roseibium sp. TaxID=1936156 RepID=UPI00391AB4F8